MLKQFEVLCKNTDNIKEINLKGKIRSIKKTIKNKEIAVKGIQLFICKETQGRSTKKAYTPRKNTRKRLITSYQVLSGVISCLTLGKVTLNYGFPHEIFLMCTV